MIKKKEKEINKLLHENESLVKAEDEYKENIDEIKRNANELIQENINLKEIYEYAELEKQHIKAELSEAEKLIERLQRTLKLKEDAIMDLHRSRNHLEKELESVTSSNFYSETNKIDYNRLKIPEKQSKKVFSVSPERNEYNFTDRQDVSSYKSICQDAMKIIGVTSSKDFYSKLLHLKQYHSKYKKSRKLLNKISDMIVQCSPLGTFSKEPSSALIWQWLKRLFEEYMKLKQSISGQAFSQLCDMFNTDDMQKIIEKIVYLLRNEKKT